MDEDLIAFFRARLDEDEASVRERWGTGGGRDAREVQAKRVILADYEKAIADYADFDVVRIGHLKRAVKLLAAVYSDHPDYSAAYGF